MLSGAALVLRDGLLAQSPQDEGSRGERSGDERTLSSPSTVMAGPVLAIHAFTPVPKDVDGRDEPGHDGKATARLW